MTDRVIHDFPTILSLLARGKAIERLDDKLAEACAALDALPDADGKASLTLQIDLRRVQDRYDIRSSVKVKLPEEPSLPPTTLFAVDGGFSLQHPSQLDMFSGPRPAKAKA